jgi:kynurenine formamidase
VPSETASTGMPSGPHAGDAPLARFVTYQMLPIRGGGRCAWEVFGAGDELGTLNWIGPAQRIRAAQLVTNGICLNLDHPLDLDLGFFGTRGGYAHRIFELMPGYLDDALDAFSPQASSQWDALRHVAAPDGMFYGGRDLSETSDIHGSLGIDKVARAGIVGRGVLVDFARDWAARPERIDPMSRRQISLSALLAVAERQHVRFEPGDILVLRFGVDERIGGPGQRRYDRTIAGIADSEEIVEWLWDNRFSAVCSDNLGVEATPVARKAGLHPRLIGLLGMTLGELLDLRALAETCVALDRTEFAFAAKPLMLPGGVGSPANAMALL